MKSQPKRHSQQDVQQQLIARHRLTAWTEERCQLDQPIGVRPADSAGELRVVLERQECEVRDATKYKAKTTTAGG
jgi:hypothetical protein